MSRKSGWYWVRCWYVKKGNKWIPSEWNGKQWIIDQHGAGFADVEMAEVGEHIPCPYNKEEQSS